MPPNALLPFPLRLFFVRRQHKQDHGEWRRPQHPNGYLQPLCVPLLVDKVPAAHGHAPLNGTRCWAQWIILGLLFRAPLINVVLESIAVNEDTEDDEDNQNDENNDVQILDARPLSGSQAPQQELPLEVEGNEVQPRVHTPVSPSSLPPHLYMSPEASVDTVWTTTARDSFMGARTASAADTAPEAATTAERPYQMPPYKGRYPLNDNIFY
ncbi:hypothetical protein C8A01DRAFT_37988 [Parachaetomium inaequale]|uniref:Uncharacterized protein n=1 Tax=Parachaetomium inaequale TaxID=2588326 RepID=A0AAN6SQ24_9PEZI|nr:hypothetical protein C8A01DRAFT_37988 [Parachaetomium inaequale]